MDSPSQQTVRQETARSFATGAATIGASAVAVLDGSSPAPNGVWVRADPANSGTVYIGNSTSVTTGTGFPLSATDSPMLLKVSDVSLLFAIASGAGQKIHWIAS